MNYLLTLTATTEMTSNTWTFASLGHIAERDRETGQGDNKGLKTLSWFGELRWAPAIKPVFYPYTCWLPDAIDRRTPFKPTYFLPRFLLPGTVMNYGTSDAKWKSQAKERPQQHSIWLALLKQPGGDGNSQWFSHKTPISISSCQSLISASQKGNISKLYMASKHPLRSTTAPWEAGAKWHLSSENLFDVSNPLK